MRRVRKWKMAALRWHAVEWAISPAGDIGWLTTAASAGSSLFPAPVQDCWGSSQRPGEIPMNIHISSFLKGVSSPPLEDCVCLCSMPRTGCPEKIWNPADVQGPVGLGPGQSDPMSGNLKPFYKSIINKLSVQEGKEDIYSSVYQKESECMCSELLFVVQYRLCWRQMDLPEFAEMLFGFPEVQVLIQ